jgi:hypothetical protein
MCQLASSPQTIGVWVMKNVDMVYNTTSKALDIIKKHRFSLGGHQATSHNNLLIQQCCEAWVLIPLESVIGSASWQSMSDKLVLFAEQLTSIDFSDALASLELAYRLIIDDKSRSIREFKAHFSGSQYRIFTPMANELSHVVKHGTGCSVNGFRNLMSFLRFPSKLTFEMETLEADALQAYLACEERLCALTYEDDKHLHAINDIIVEWLEDINVEFLPVRHGTGSVMEGNLSKYEKYFTLGSDPLLSYVIRKYGDPAIPMEHYFPFGTYSHVVWERASRVKFVPKNAKKLRTICMEPVTLQYFQQGVMRVIYKYMTRHPFLSERVKLHDQTQNQEAAQLGSSLNNYATIDLSAASDSVSWSLVKQLFKGTRILPFMIATRSRVSILPDGTEVAQEKFAPMGSALCFPTECLIFCAITEYVARCHDCRYDGTKESYTFYTIYGDDIVVPTNWVKPLVHLLTRYGFLVNEDKSFTNGPFRESCGKEYYQGRDVTPVYYRFDVIEKSVTHRNFVRACTAANNAANAGLTYLRAFYVDISLRKNRKNIAPNLRKLGPLFSDSLQRAPHIFSSHPTNYSARSTWKRNLYAMSTDYLTVASAADEEVSHVIQDRISYHEFLVERLFNPNRNVELEPAFESNCVVPRSPVWKQGRSINS